MAKILRQPLLTALRFGVTQASRFESTRRLLNPLYLRLSPARREWFHTRFSQVHRGRSWSVTPGVWEVRFANRRIRLPLGEEPWLEWDAALSAVGHEVPVKRFYERVINAWGENVVFFDVGANYGIHSVLVAAAGGTAVAIEPNPGCVPYFRCLQDVNDVAVRLVQKALGAEGGMGMLHFDQRATWNGVLTTSREKRPNPGESAETQGSGESIVVEVTTLDDVARDLGLAPNLIKIDTEGSELEVLKGGTAVLGQSPAPIIVFESWRVPDMRSSVASYLTRFGFRLYRLGADGPERIDFESFVGDPSTNFVAADRGSWLA